MGVYKLTILVLVATMIKIEVTIAKAIGEEEVESTFVGARADLFEGDILIKKTARNAIAANLRWPGGRVIYQLDPNFTDEQRALIYSSMSEFHQLSCVRFQARVSEPDYVFISRSAPGAGCNSFVGRIGGRQILNLEPNCLYSGPIGHELFHAAGFNHEHSRMDRDSYVRVLWENIPSGWYSAFNKIQGDTLGLPYDYQSIAQYPKWAFSSNGKDTIVPYPNTNAPFGQYAHLVAGDGVKLNTLYRGLCN